MNIEGLKELYQGHEIAAHCLTHADLPKYDEETIRNEILEDKKIWKNGLGSLLWEWRIRLVLITIP